MILLFVLALDPAEDAAKSFARMASDFRDDVRLTVEHEYDRQKAGLQRTYDDTIKKREREEKARRDSAIATFEAFLRKYPNDRTYTPDAMFRLSELYFERANDSEALGRYGKTIALYQRLIERFPDYRLLDAAYYLLGYCQGEEGDDDAATRAYEALVTKFPQSKFFAEAWTRIGEYYFDNNELDKAVHAYSQVLTVKPSPYYDKALYKLAWTEYRLDHFDAAVKRFAELIDLGKSDLRGEALQYLGISFADEKWGGLDKAKQFFSTPKAWEAEAYAMLGDMYFDQTKYPEAVAAYRWGLQRRPTAPDAPKMQDRIVQAYERQRDFDGATRERDVLADLYTDSSAWAHANAENPDALSAARDLSERSLLAAATFHHRQAQAYKDGQQAAQAKAAYMRAAQGYWRYLKRFPTARNRYELMYYLADCEYYSQQLPFAADMYGRVRDDEAEDIYREPAAYSAILSLEQDTATSKKQLVAACDAYVRRTGDTPRTPAIMFKAAEVFFNDKQFPVARERLQAILLKYPKHQVAQATKNLIIESYLAEKNWDAVEKFADLDPSLRKYKLGAIFKKAEALDAKEQYEAAAKEYLRVVSEDPKSTYADKALNNAAVAYEKVRRFESATRIYERIPREFPGSPLADYALFRVGINSERFYDFDKAIGSYLKLVDTYPQSKHRADALYNAALALENTQKYAQAETQYRRYAELFPDRPDAPEVFFKAARAADQAGRKADADRLYDQFVQRYGKQQGQDDRVVEAQFRSENYALAVKEAANRQAGAVYAAQAQFQLAEKAFEAYDAIAIDGSTKAQKAAIVKKAKALTQVRDVYQKVFPFKQVEWTLASLYRIGNLYETFADKLFAVPAPPEVRRLGEEYVEEYRVLLEEQAAPLEDKAVDAYKRTLDEAKKAGVANAWTKRTLKSLSKLRKKEFPLQKDGRFQLEPNGFAPADLVGSPTT